MCLHIDIDLCLLTGSSTSLRGARPNSSDEIVDDHQASGSDEKFIRNFSPSRSNQEIIAKSSKSSNNQQTQDSSKKLVKSSKKSESEKPASGRTQGSKSPKQGSASKSENQNTGLEGGDNENNGKQVNIEIEVTDTSKEVEPKRSRSTTPQYLAPPEQDTAPEHIVMSSDEAMVDLRKRDREALKTNMMRMVRQFRCRVYYGHSVTYNLKYMQIFIEICRNVRN